MLNGKKVSIEDFQKLDIRIGTVIAAEVPSWSHWVMKLTVDLGEKIGTRIVFAGIMKFFRPEDLIGKQFPFVVNLPDKKIGPEKEMSRGMMLMACPQLPDPDNGAPAVSLDGEDTPPVLFLLPKKVPNGTKVM